MTFKCEYCKNSFKRESTLATHMCPKKKRHMQKDDANVRIGFRAFQLFYKIGTNSKKTKTYDDFADSQYYAAFVRFGSYAIDLGIDDVSSYVEWLLRNQVKLDKWTSDTQFNLWIKERLKSESVDRAFERTVLFLTEWGEETGNEWHTYFDMVNPNRAVFHICSGKLSPWIIFASDKAQHLIDRFNEEQLGMVADYIDADYWQRKMTVSKPDFEWVTSVLKEAHLA